MEEILNKYSSLNQLNVSRETFSDFEIFINMIIEKNSEINIISKKNSNSEDIRTRHIIDTAQAVDFIDLNFNTTSDLGSGGGMPGIITAIMLKNIKKEVKVNLYEKNRYKGSFLKDVSEKLKLNKRSIFAEMGDFFKFSWQVI